MTGIIEQRDVGALHLPAKALHGDSIAPLSRSSWAPPPTSVKPSVPSVSAISLASLDGLSSGVMFL